MYLKIISYLIRIPETWVERESGHKSVSLFPGFHLTSPKPKSVVHGITEDKAKVLDVWDWIAKHSLPLWARIPNGSGTMKHTSWELYGNVNPYLESPVLTIIIHKNIKKKDYWRFKFTNFLECWFVNKSHDLHDIKEAKHH